MSDAVSSLHGTLSPLLAPRSIAVIGASDDTSKTGGRALHYLSHFGYTGDVFAVNSKRATVQGHRTFSSPGDLPLAADLAIIAVPGMAAMEAVIACGERGVGAAIVTSSGFSELGVQGAKLEQQMARHARCAGMRLVGPNSQGVANFATRTVASFSSLFLTYPPRDGPVAVISQSGSMSVVPYCQLREQGIGVRYCVATGNEADLSVGDFAEHVLADAEIKLVLLYLESISERHALQRAAALARERGVPMVAVKSGRSRGGQSAALSHTGALASEDRIISAFFERHGIYRADDADELVRCTRLYLKRWRPTGTRLTILTDSGASAVMLADKADQLGLEVSPFPASTQHRLIGVLPDYAVTRNPVDMTSVLRAEPDRFERVLEVIAQEDVTDLIVVAFPASGEGYDVPRLAQMAAEFCARCDLALAVAVPQPPIARLFRDAGLPTFHSETEALLALRQLVTHTRMSTYRDEIATVPEFPVLPCGRTRLVAETEALDFFRACALSVQPFILCTTLACAKAAYRTLGPRVVMKGMARGVAHKAKLGLGALRVHDELSVETQFERLMQRQKALDLSIDGILVAKECEFDAEFAVGAKVDAVLGPVVMVGEGGRDVETGRDPKVKMAPVSVAEARAVLQRLRLGKPEVSGRALESLAHLVNRVSLLIEHHQHDIATLDLNPVVIDNEAAVILDALVERSHGDVIS